MTTSPTPQRKTAREVATQILGECHCHAAYKDRKLTDPTCVWCDNVHDLEEAILSERSFYLGELEGVRETLSGASEFLDRVDTCPSCDSEKRDEHEEYCQLFPVYKALAHLNKLIEEGK